MPIVIHVACDHELFRKSIAALLDCHEQLEVRRTSPEGVLGVLEVRKTDPDVLVLAVPPKENIAEHVEWYREALPDAGIVGFCFLSEQADAYRQAGVEEVVYSHNTTSDLFNAIKRACDAAATS